MSEIGRYYRISSRFWQDERVLSWNDDTRLLALYLLTSPHRNMVGFFVLPKPYIYADLRWPSKRLEQPFGQLLADGFLQYDDKTQLMLVNNALKYDRPQNPNQVKAAINAVLAQPRSTLLAAFLTVADRFCEPLHQGLRQPLAQRVRNTEPDTEPDTETKPMCVGEQTHEVGSVPKAKKTTGRNDYSPDFEKFWQAYPRKVVKRDAYEKWQVRLKERLDPDKGGAKITAEMLLVATRNYAEECRRCKREADKIKHPGTFLSAKHPFADYLDTAAVEAALTGRRDLHPWIPFEDSREDAPR